MVVLEHSLIMLLLLVGLLNARPRLHRFIRWTILGALALAFIAPSVPMGLPWDLLAALTIPLLLWQIARRSVTARWPAQRREIALWLAMTVGIGGLLSSTAKLTSTELVPSSALLFGLLAASMAWRATEEMVQPSHLGQLGPLALAFLLAEIAPAVEAPNRYLLALVSGAGLGAVVGYIAVHIAQRLAVGLRRDIWSIGQAYLAYGLGLALDISSVAAVVLCIALYVSYGVRRGLWPDGDIRLRPLDTTPISFLAIAALAFFGWQTPVPIEPVLLLEIGVSLLITGLVVWVGSNPGNAHTESPGQ